MELKHERRHFDVGEFHCLAVNDGRYIGNARTLFTNAPEQGLKQALKRHGLTPDQLPAAWTCLLVNTPDHLVLIDTGENNAVGLGGGRLLPAMQAEGMSPADVDTVILTHGHADHIGGCVNPDGQPAFPNARYVMWASEWEYWTAEANLEKMSPRVAQLVRHCLLPLQDHLELLSREQDIVPGIGAIAAPGHTVGHIALQIRSQGEQLLHMGDSVLHPIHVEHPDWISAMDQNPEQTISTRQDLFQRAADEQALMLAFHFMPFPGLGHILWENGRWHWFEAQPGL